MKKSLFLVLVISFTLFFSGCGGGGGSSSVTTPLINDNPVDVKEVGSKTIQIADNNFGDWELDSIQTIGWVDSTKTADTTYSLYVLNDQKVPVGMIGSGVAGNKMSWKVGEFFKDNIYLHQDSRYYIKVISNDGKCGYGISVSFVFKTDLRHIMVDETYPGLTVGQTEVISWTDNEGSYDSMYTIFVIDATGDATCIIGEVVGTRAFVWEVGSIKYGNPYLALPSGREYYIQVVAQEPLYSSKKSAYYQTKRPFYISYPGEKGAPSVK